MIIFRLTLIRVGNIKDIIIEVIENSRLTVNVLRGYEILRKRVSISGL